MMKIAILFDFIEGVSGGEKLLLFLAKKYKADIYTGYANLDRSYKEFKKFNINVLGKIPKIQLIKQEMFVRKFRSLDLSDYDATICLGFYSIYASLINHPVIWNAYGVSSLFYRRANFPKEFLNQSLTWRIGAEIWRRRIQNYDKKIVKKYIDKIITISEYSRQAFKNYYNRDSVIIPPPVDMKKHYYKPSKDYYLVVSRLEHGKRVDLAVKAFKNMPDKTLFIEGNGSLRKILEKLAGNAKNIKFLGRASSEELLELYANCIALIGTAFYDDWSMPMIEAMASGKPVIGVNQGAYPEIIIKNTGVLVDGSPKGIINGVKKITPEVAKNMKNVCIKRAKEVDTNSFYKKWDKVLNEIIK